MFDKKKQEKLVSVPEPPNPITSLEANVATLREQQAPKEPSALDILREDRQHKIELVKRLTQEIHQLDADITHAELGPENLRILERIATRFVRRRNEQEHDTGYIAR